MSVEWYNRTLILGLKKEYMLMEVATQETSPLFPLEKATPIIKFLGSEILLVIQKNWDFLLLKKVFLLVEIFCGQINQMQ